MDFCYIHRGLQGQLKDLLVKKKDKKPYNYKL